MSDGRIGVRLRWDGDKIIKQMDVACAEAVEAAADELLQIANETVPYKTGALMESGIVRAKSDGSATVSYNTPYARRMHEHPEYNFEGNGRGKWLELAFQENKDRLLRGIADKIKQIMG